MATLNLKQQSRPRRQRQTSIITSNVFILLVCLIVSTASAFAPIANQRRNADLLTQLYAGDNKETDTKKSKEPNQDVDFVTKASWYAVEWFGKAAAAVKNDGNNESDTTTTTKYDTSLPPQSLSETLQRIKDDNDRYYFLSGKVDKEIYDPECIFRDPFVAFAGRDRFVENLANLGSFITNYDARVLKYDEAGSNDEGATTITTKIMVKLELNLPWKPILAWPWGVTYTIDPKSNLIYDHEESWDIGAWDGVQQIFRKPTVSLPASKKE